MIQRIVPLCLRVFVRPTAIDTTCLTGYFSTRSMSEYTAEVGDASISAETANAVLVRDPVAQRVCECATGMDNINALMPRLQCEVLIYHSITARTHRFLRGCSAPL
jgi:hypothetical protein